jgi:colanic acid/amylovoran biosynthesis glycosyltransferase
VRLAHIHFLWNAVWFFDFWRKPTIPVLVTAHGTDVNNAFENPNYRGRIRRALDEADAIVCVSRFIKERLMALGCPEDKLIVNALGVPIPKIEAFRGEGRDRASSIVNLICVAALREDKGHRYLLEAVRKVRDSHPDVRLDLVGDGPLRDPILRQIRATGLDDCVRLLGWQSEEEVFRLMAESDICAQPSVRHVVKGESHREEGLPLSLVEAAAVGLPIVASRVGGISEICRHGLNGLLSEERDSDAMAGNILAFIRDPDMRRRFGDQGRGIARAEFDERTSVDRLESLYEDRIAAAGHRKRR